MRAKLKFKHLPWELEHKLVTKYGFSVYSRLQGIHVIIVKYDNKEKSFVDPNFLTEAQKSDLIHKCNKIVEFYDRPEFHMKQIQIRLKNLASTLGAAERKYITEWGDKWVALGDVDEIMID